MTKRITQTRTNYVGTPRLDFLTPDFDALVDNKGYDVIWERALQCPCGGRMTPNLSVCKNCQGSGWLFINPTQIKAVAQSINKTTKYKEWSQELLGTVSLTVKSDFTLNFMDKISFLSAQSLQNEVLVIRLYQKSLTEQVLFISTIYPIVEVKEIFKFDAPNKPLILLNKSTYSVSNNKVTFIGDTLKEGDKLTVSYKHNVQYNILDINHDIRNTMILDTMSREVLLELPISAIGRRVHNVIDSSNFTEDNIFDNSYL